MFRKPIAHLLVGALFLSFISASAITAQSKTEITPAFTANVRKRIVKLGTGLDAKVQVKLQDKTKLKGYVSKITEDLFVVTDPKTNAETTVSYPNVTELKTKMSTGEVITISALAAVGGFFLIAAIVARHVD
jgi:DNA-directed RNA polymerase beta' subunit